MLQYVQDIQASQNILLYKFSDKFKVEHVSKSHTLLYILQYLCMYRTFKHFAIFLYLCIHIAILSFVQDIQAFCKYTLYRNSSLTCIKIFKTLSYILQYLIMYWTFKHVTNIVHSPWNKKWQTCILTELTTVLH